MPPISSSAAAAQDRAGAAEERGVPEVVAVLNYAVEELAFVGDDVELAEIALERIGRIKVMRRLHHGQLGVAHEPADGHLEKAARGHVVGIKDSHERRSHGFKRGVDVAGLGKFVVGARAVADAGLECKLLKFLAATVVEDVDVELVGGPIHVERAESGEADDVERLVESGNEHVNVGPVFRILGQRNGSTAQGPDGLEVAEKKNDKCVGLGEKQAEDEESVQRAPVIGGVAKEANDLIDAPVSVAKGTEHGQHHEGERDEIGIGAAREGQGHEKAEQSREPPAAAR